MNAKLHRTENQSPNAIRDNSLLALMRVSQPSPTVTKPKADAPVSNTMRATTITVVLEEILTHTRHRQRGIDE